MMKPRHSLRSNLTALLMIGGAFLSVTGCGFAGPAAGQKPAKTAAVKSAPKKVQTRAKAEVRAPANYPRDANGFWDWKNSPDIKSGVVDPRLVEFYTLQQKMRADLLGTFSGHEALGDSDMFIVDNKAARSSNKALFGTEYGIDYAVGWFMFRKYTPDMQLSEKGSMRYIIANLAAKSLIDKRSRDPNMRLLLANTLENQVRALTFTPNLLESASYNLSRGCNEAVWNELLGKVTRFKGEYWKDDSYDGAKKIRMANATCEDLEMAKSDIEKYINFLKSDKYNQRGLIKSFIYTEAIKLLHKPSVNLASAKL